MKKIYNELCFYKKYIFNCMKSIISFFAILIYFRMFLRESSFNFMLLILFFIIVWFYNNSDKKYKKIDKRTMNYSKILSVIISSILIVGSLVIEHVTNPIANILTIRTLIKGSIGIFGLYLLFSRLFAFSFKKLPNLIEKNNKMSLKGYFGIVLLLLLCWLPYFLRFYPGVMTPDSYFSILNVQNKVLSDYHTLGHTWFFGGFYLLGKLIFHNTNMAIAFYIIIQMLICASLFAYLIKYLYDKGIKKIFLIIVCLWFMFSPLFAIYSITLWRDILFGMAFITLFISLYEFVNCGNKFNVKYLFMYLFSVLFILFFRNNGIYIILLFIPFFVWLSKGNRKVVAIVNIAIVTFYFIIKGPVFSYFNVQTTTSVEAFSMPLQQIARVIVNDGNIDKDTYKYFEEIFDVDLIKKTYKPTISDYVKRSTSNEKVSADKTKFMITWLKVGISNPKLYAESYLCSTLGYWYPDVVYWATAGAGSSIFEEVDAYTDPKGPTILKKLDVLVSRKLPFSVTLWSIGTMFIVLICSTSILLYKEKRQYILAYIPLYCLWISLMVASPVFSELRYIYGLFVCIPLLIFVPFINTKVIKKSSVSN